MRLKIKNNKVIMTPEDKAKVGFVGQLGDIYLYVAAHIDSYAEAVRATGYDPLAPTPETLARAKKECKHIRSICKTVVLACQYGAGVNKVMQVLEQDDVFLSYDEVHAIHAGYWELFSGVRDFSKSLYYEWRRNRGWILNGMGRPMAVPEEMNKDILNRFVQSTGHDILLKYIAIVGSRLDAEGISWDPVVLDWHDATTIEVPEKYADAARNVLDTSVDVLNKQLQGRVSLRGTAEIGYNLSDVKAPEE